MYVYVYVYRGEGERERERVRDGHEFSGGRVKQRSCGFNSVAGGGGGASLFVLARAPRGSRLCRDEEREFFL